MGRTIAPNAMLTIAEIAERDGTSRPSVSGIVKRLVEQYGLTVERDTRGRVARVNAAQYDRLRGASGKDGRTATDTAKAYAEARAEKTKNEAARGRLELLKESGKLVPRDEVQAAALEAITIFRGAFDLAASEIGPRLAHSIGREERVVRPLLRQLRERTLGEFRRCLATKLGLDPSAAEAAANGPDAPPMPHTAPTGDQA